MKHPHFWVIRSKTKSESVFGEMRWMYFARRTSIKNPRFLSEFSSDVKWFETKEEALEYLVKKCRHCGPLKVKCRVIRKKMFLDKKGKYDYWKNRTSLIF